MGRRRAAGKAGRTVIGLDAKTQVALEIGTAHLCFRAQFDPVAAQRRLRRLQFCGLCGLCGVIVS